MSVIVVFSDARLPYRHRGGKYVCYLQAWFCKYLALYDVSLTFNENKCVHMNLYNRCDIAAFIVVRG